MDKHPVKILLTTLAFAGLLLLVEMTLGWQAVLAPWQAQPWALILAACGLTLLTYALRAVRLYDYFRADMRGHYGAALKIMLQHNLANNFLPMRTGELSFPLLLKHHFGLPASRSLPALLWFRLLDLHALGLIVLVSLGLWLSAWQWLIWPASLAWLASAWLGWHFSQILLAALGRRLAGRHESTLANLRAGLPTDAGQFWRSLAWSQANWWLKMAVFAWVLALFAPLPAAAAWLGAVGGDLSSVLPIHGFAGAGTYEAGVVAMLSLFRLEIAGAATAAINLHLFVLGACVAGGACSLLLPGGRR